MLQNIYTEKNKCCFYVRKGEKSVGEALFLRKQFRWAIGLEERPS